MIRWFRQYAAITRNAFTVSLSDPVFLILVLSVLVGMAFFGSLPIYSFGQELRLVRDQSMALIFIGGCLVAMLTAISVVVRDLQQGAVSVLMSRPVSGLSVVAGKWTGLAGAVLVYQIPATVACLWVTRIAKGHDQQLDTVALSIYFISIVATLATMGIRHYFLGGWFVWQASLALIALFTLGFVLCNFVDGNFKLHAWGANVDWRTLAGCAMVFLAELVFLAAILPFAIKFDAPIVMGVGVVIFFFGMVSSFLAGKFFEPGFAQVACQSLLPNWQAFWISDLLAERGKFESARALPYMLNCVIHTIAYVGLGTCASAILFNRREFSGNDSF